MKRILTFLLVIMLVLCCAACEFATEEEVNSSAIESNNGSSDSSLTESSSEPDNSGEVSVESTDEPDDESSSAESNSEPDVNPYATKEITDISITINGYNELKSNGYEISNGSDKKVSVKVNGPADIVNGLTSGSIKATVDVANLSEKGDVELLITYTAPAEVVIIETSDNFVNFTVKKTSSVIVPPVVDEIRLVNGVLISGTRAMEQFGGGESGGQKTANMLNEFKQAMGDVNVYVLPAPLASAFYAPVGYEKSIERHKTCFYAVRDNLSNVSFVDTLSALSAHTDEEIYFRTDHHWQALAAYYACEEFARVAGVPFDNIANFSVHTISGILGSFYSSYTHDEVLKNNPDTMTWYEPTRPHTVEYYSRDGHDGTPITGRTLFSSNEGYTKFIYGDSYTTHIKSNVGNGRKLLLFKDSYGNALAPFLVGSFDEIIIADYRYFKTDVSDFIAEQGITDVCFELAAFKVNNCNAVDINY